jgi:predicted Zn-dependent protease with MMP-like domain
MNTEVDPAILPPSAELMEAMADDALRTLPPMLAQHVVGVAIRIEEFVDEETELDLDLESPFDLLGLYRGTPLTQRSVGGVASDVDMILLYRRAILDYWCETGEDLKAVVRHVLIHEIGHHFGFSDADMERLEQDGA